MRQCIVKNCFLLKLISHSVFPTGELKEPNPLLLFVSNDDGMWGKAVGSGGQAPCLSSYVTLER